MSGIGHLHVALDDTQWTFIADLIDATGIIDALHATGVPAIRRVRHAALLGGQLLCDLAIVPVDNWHITQLLNTTPTAIQDRWELRLPVNIADVRYGRRTFLRDIGGDLFTIDGTRIDVRWVLNQILDTLAASAAGWPQNTTRATPWAPPPASVTAGTEVRS